MATRRRFVSTNHGTSPQARVLAARQRLASERPVGCTDPRPYLPIFSDSLSLPARHGLPRLAKCRLRLGRFSTKVRQCSCRRCPPDRRSYKAIGPPSSTLSGSLDRFCHRRPCRECALPCAEVGRPESRCFRALPDLEYATPAGLPRRPCA